MPKKKKKGSGVVSIVDSDMQFNSSTILLQLEATNAHNFIKIAIILQHGMDNAKKKVQQYSDNARLL
jgi:hypothetical protein